MIGIMIFATQAKPEVLFVSARDKGSMLVRDSANPIGLNCYFTVSLRKAELVSTTD